MGCGESKHVATGNTISRKNSRAESKRGKSTSEAIKETTELDSNTSSLVKEECKNINQDSAADISRAVAESTELKKEENGENDKEKTSGVAKENEEPIEGVASKGISGRSEYHSPPEEAGKESLSDENVKPADALEAKKLPKETKEETLDEKESAQETKVETKKENVEETKEETGNGEPETVKEAKMVKETETAETTKAKTSTPVQKEEEKPAGSPALDLKTE
ncbi:uncharacterized protein LOC111279324 [Durio zibethinus]|uniref:Uncharacterized protein LOC111279324 n=1 Tax=Durio zibethinus TaxID=66656 RepID=A0A6P5X0Z8_DURZI|nr:uncharacterized protein LOC111279324 [Durio zibethinus]